jgi:hypothetical protein
VCETCRAHQCLSFNLSGALYFQDFGGSLFLFRRGLSCAFTFRYLLLNLPDAALANTMRDKHISRGTLKNDDAAPTADALHNSLDKLSAGWSRAGILGARLSF